MIARNKWPLRAGVRTYLASPGQNARNSVRVLVSYRAFPRARAFRPISRAGRSELPASPNALNAMRKCASSNDGAASAGAPRGLQILGDAERMKGPVGLKRQAARLMRPLVDALARHVMAGARVHGDYTVVPVLEPGLGRTRTARLWTYVRDDRPFGGADPPAALYRYSPDRKGEHPREHLRTFRSILQADGYAGFAGLYGDGRVVEAACLAHARRKFWDVHEATKSPLAREALDRIAALYRIEDTIRGRPPDQRLRARTEHTAPLMAELRDWLDATRLHISGRSDLAAAIRYALSRWEALTLILRDGRACIDNSAGRARHATDYGRPAQLDLCRIGRWRRARSGDLQPDRDGKATRARP